jgi:hypothetical protein
VGTGSLLLEWAPCHPSEDPDKVLQESPVVGYTYSVKVAGGPTLVGSTSAGVNLQALPSSLNLARAASQGRLQATVTCTNKAGLKVGYCTVHYLHTAILHKVGDTRESLCFTFVLPSYGCHPQSNTLSAPLQLDFTGPVAQVGATTAQGPPPPMPPMVHGP